VHDSCLVFEKVDSWVWKDDKLQEFSFNAAYGTLRGVHEGIGRGYLNYFGGLRLFHQLRLPFGGCWKIGLLLRLIYLDMELRSKAFATFVG